MSLGLEFGTTRCESCGEAGAIVTIDHAERTLNVCCDECQFEMWGTYRDPPTEPAAPARRV